MFLITNRTSDFPIQPGSPDRAGGSSRTGDLLFATVLVWAGPSAAAPALLELQMDSLSLRGSWDIWL